MRGLLWRKFYLIQRKFKSKIKEFPLFYRVVWGFPQIKHPGMHGPCYRRQASVSPSWVRGSFSTPKCVEKASDDQDPIWLLIWRGDILNITHENFSLLINMEPLPDYQDHPFIMEWRSLTIHLMSPMRGWIDQTDVFSWQYLGHFIHFIDLYGVMLMSKDQKHINYLD